MTTSVTVPEPASRTSTLTWYKYGSASPFHRCGRRIVTVWVTSTPPRVPAFRTGDRAENTIRWFLSVMMVRVSSERAEPLLKTLAVTSTVADSAEIASGRT